MPRLALPLLVVVLVVGCQPAAGTKPGGATTSAATSPPVGPVVELQTPGEIHKEFSANLIAGDQKWVGKRVRVSVYAAGVEKQEDKYVLTTHNNAVFWIETAHAGEFARVTPRTTLRIEATLVRCDQGVTSAAAGLQLVFSHTRLIEQGKTDPIP